MRVPCFTLMTSNTTGLNERRVPTETEDPSLGERDTTEDPPCILSARTPMGDALPLLLLPSVRLGGLDTLTGSRGPMPIDRRLRRSSSDLSEGFIPPSMLSLKTRGLLATKLLKLSSNSTATAPVFARLSCSACWIEGIRPTIGLTGQLRNCNCGCAMRISSKVSNWSMPSNSAKAKSGGGGSGLSSVLWREACCSLRIEEM